MHPAIEQLTKRAFTRSQLTAFIKNDMEASNATLRAAACDVLTQRLDREHKMLSQFGLRRANAETNIRLLSEIGDKAKRHDLFNPQHIQLARSAMSLSLDEVE